MRTVRPALTSSTTDNATSITTSRLRVRLPCVPAPVLRPALSASVTSGFDGLQRRHQAEHDAREQRHAKRKQQHRQC